MVEARPLLIGAGYVMFRVIARGHTRMVTPAANWFGQDVAPGLTFCEARVIARGPTRMVEVTLAADWCGQDAAPGTDI